MSSEKNPQGPKAEGVSSSSGNSVPFAEVVPTEEEKLQQTVDEATTGEIQAKSDLHEFKEALEKTYKSLDTPQNEIDSLIKEIESGKNADKSLHKNYYDAYTKWIQASQELKKAVGNLQKYQSNSNVSMPEIMVFLKDFKEEIINELKKENEELKRYIIELHPNINPNFPYKNDSRRFKYCTPLSRVGQRVFAEGKFGTITVASLSGCQIKYDDGTTNSDSWKGYYDFNVNPVYAVGEIPDDPSA